MLTENQAVVAAIVISIIVSVGGFVYQDHYFEKEKKELEALIASSSCYKTSSSVYFCKTPSGEWLEAQKMFGEFSQSMTKKVEVGDLPAAIIFAESVKEIHSK